MAKTIPAIKPRPKMTLVQWIVFTIVFAVIVFGFQTFGIINFPSFGTSNSGNSNTDTAVQNTDGSAGSSSSTSNKDEAVYSGSITFTADTVYSRQRADSTGSLGGGSTGATEHVSTTMSFSGYKLGAYVVTRPYDVPVSGTYDYSCATTGNYIPKYTGSLPSSASFSGYADAEPSMGMNNDWKNGVTLIFNSNTGGKVVETYTDLCKDANGAGMLISQVIHDIFSNYYGNTDKLAVVGGYPTYFFNKDGETVSFGRTFEQSKDTNNPRTITYSGTVTVVRDK